MRLADLSYLEENAPASKPVSWSWIPWIGLVVGIVVLGQLYHQASQEPVDYLFGRFWLGMFLFFIPLFWRQLSANVSRFERISLLVGTALFSYLPKLFRCATFFCYSDELTWWRGVQDLLNGSPLLTENPLGEVQGFFPGLPLLTIVLQKASGLSTFQVGFVLIGLVHLLALLSIFLLGEALFNSSKVGAIAALVYLTNPAYFFFSTQFSYESLAVPLILMALLFVQSILSSPEGKLGRAWILTICMSIAAVVIIHHLSALMLVALLTLMALAAWWLPRFSWFQRSSRQLNFITIFAYASTFAWIAFVAWDVFRYIGDPFAQGLNQIAGYTVRQLFAGTPLPLYEVYAGYVAAVLIGLLALLGALLIYRAKQNLYAAQIGLLAFGSLYFLTAPLVLTSWGSEAGRRSWTFAYISLSLLAGLSLTWFLAQKSMGKFRPKAYWIQGSAAFVLVLLLVGGVASSTTLSYRFPGEYLHNADARSYTVEIIDAAQWLFSQAGKDNRVLGDRTTERIFGSYGLQQPAMLGGPRPWEVFLPTSWTPEAVYWLEQAEAPFVVVDKRMAELSPQMDTRFQRGEPPLEYSDRPLPSAAIEKFDQLAQLDRLFDSGNIRIYGLNASAQALAASSQAERQVSHQYPRGFELEAASPTGLNLFFSFLRAIFVIIFLVIPGLILGKWVFPNWSSLGFVKRLLIGCSIHISLIIILMVIFAWLFPTIEIAATITLVIVAFVLVSGLVSLLEKLYQEQPTQQEISTSLKQFFQEFRSPNLAMALSLSAVALILVVYFTGAIQPKTNPRTVFALEFSAAGPSFSIKNLEGNEQTYLLKIHGGNSRDWSSNPIVLRQNQSARVDFPRSFLSNPNQAALNIDLYLDGEAGPHRSLHFVPDPAGIGN